MTKLSIVYLLTAVVLVGTPSLAFPKCRLQARALGHGIEDGNVLSRGFEDVPKAGDSLAGVRDERLAGSSASSGLAGEKSALVKNTDEASGGILDLLKAPVTSDGKSAPWTLGGARVLDRESLETSQSRYLGLEKIEWRDVMGNQRWWEAVRRKKEGNDGLPDAVAMFTTVSAQNMEKSVVLVAQFRPQIGKVVIELPAGLIDKGETVAKAALRELLEETGYGEASHGEASFERVLSQLANDPGMSASQTALAHLSITIKGNHVAPQSHPEASEHIKVLLVPVSNLLETLTKANEEKGFTVDSRLMNLAVGHAASLKPESALPENNGEDLIQTFFTQLRHSVAPDNGDPARTLKPASIVERTSLETSKSKFLGLQSIKWEDETGETHTWEGAFRKKVTTLDGKPDAVAMFTTVSARNLPPSVVVVAQFRPPVGKVVIELPAGLMDGGETVEQTALRELYEETGYGKKPHSAEPSTPGAEPSTPGAEPSIHGAEPSGAEPSGAEPSGSDGMPVIKQVFSQVANDPGMSAGEMALAQISVTMKGDHKAPKNNPDAGEHIDVFLLPLHNILETLTKANGMDGIAVDARLMHLAMGHSLGS